MKSNTRILKYIAAAALAAGSVSAVSAAGLLGQRYAGATLDWVLLDQNQVDGGSVEDGNGVSLTLNLPLSSNVDLSIDYAFLDSGGRVDFGEGDTIRFDAHAQALLFNSTFYMPAGQLKPFVKVGAGWAGTRIAGNSDSDAVYRIVPGVEIPAGSKASLTLYASWTDYFGGQAQNEGYWDFGAVAEFEVASQWSVLARTSIDEDSNWGLSAGVLFRF